MVFKKAQNVEDKLKAIDERLIELTQKLNSKKRDLDEKKIEVADILGQLALEEDAETEERRNRSKKSTERLSEIVNDLTAQIELLKVERSKQAFELHQAQIREIPGKLEAIAKNYNLILDEAVGLIDAFEVLHRKALEVQGTFTSLQNQRSDALTKLKKIEPLNLAEGLGRLSQAGSPYGSTFLVSPDVADFFRMLIMYRQNLKNYEAYKLSNPKSDEPIPQEEVKFGLFDKRIWS